MTDAIVSVLLKYSVMKYKYHYYICNLFLLSIRVVGLQVYLFRWEMHTKFWLESLKGRDHLEDLGIDGRTVLK
jgi:hypothetical protein